MLNRALKKGAEDLEEDLIEIQEKIKDDRKLNKVNNGDISYRDRILQKIRITENNNIQITLDTLFPKGGHLYLNGAKYSIFDYTWTNKKTYKIESGEEIKNNPFYVQYVTKTKYSGKNRLINDYIEYLNKFWRKFSSSSSQVPLYRNIEEFYKMENRLHRDQYSPDELVEARRILDRATNDIKYAIYGRNLEISKLINDNRHVPNPTAKMFEDIVKLDSSNKLNLVSSRYGSTNAYRYGPIYDPRYPYPYPYPYPNTRQRQLPPQQQTRRRPPIAVPVPVPLPVANVIQGGYPFSRSSYNYSTSRPQKVCYYVIIIDLEIFPKDEIGPLDDYRLGCQLRKLEIKKAFRQVLGMSPVDTPELSIYGVKNYGKSKRRLEIEKDAKNTSYRNRERNDTITNRQQTQRKNRLRREVPVRNNVTRRFR